MGPSRSRAGFTLIELMVVVAIIGISLLAFMPSFMQAMADRRAATASMEMVRLGRRARSESIGLGRAFLLNINYGIAPLQTARMVLLRGNAARCDVDDWATLANICLPNDEREQGATACLESLNFANTHWYHAPYAMTVGMWRANETPTSVTPDTVVQETGNGARQGSTSICYEPGGTVRWTVTPLGLGPAMNFSTLNQREAAGGGLMFAVGLVDRSTRLLTNVPRVSLFPLAGTPRRLR